MNEMSANQDFRYNNLYVVVSILMRAIYSTVVLYTLRMCFDIRKKKLSLHLIHNKHVGDDDDLLNVVHVTLNEVWICNDIIFFCQPSLYYTIRNVLHFYKVLGIIYLQL